jgi:acetolactate synthase-1/2/3 large subunit
LTVEVKSLLSKMQPTAIREFEERKKTRGKEILSLKGELKYYVEPTMFSDAVPIMPQRAVKEIREFLDKDAILLADCGNNMTWIERYYQTLTPRGVLTDGALSAMGFTVAASIGVKLAQPSRQVVDVCGNASFTMLCKEVNTAAAYRVPVIWCIFNDRNLGMVIQGQKFGYGTWEPERFIATQSYVMDFVKFAEACHAYGQMIDRPSEIKDALKSAFDSGKPSIIDIKIDPDVVPLGTIKRFETVASKYPDLAQRNIPKARFPL